MTDLTEHPRRQLSFICTGSPGEKDAETIRGFIASIAHSKSWSTATPIVLDEVDDSESEPSRILGGVLEVYSALPPWGQRLPREVEIAVFRDCEYVVAELEKFTEVHKYEFDLYFDRTFAGTIANGISDKLITIGLIGEWKRVLDEEGDRNQGDAPK